MIHSVATPPYLSYRYTITVSNHRSESYQLAHIESKILYNHVSDCQVLRIYNNNSVALVRQRTIPTERPPLVGEVSANFSG
jgi:hypothetical protein